MQRVRAAPGQFAVNRNQILNAADLARQNDLLALEPHFFGQPRRVESRGDECLIHDLFGFPGFSAKAVFIHQAGEQFLVQAAPVHTDTHRFVPTDCGLNHLTKLPIMLVTFADIARIDPVFG